MVLAAARLRARPLALLAAAVVAYALAAWAVAPGFYDGIAPPQPYRWVSPPPGVLRITDQQPQAGQGTVRVGAQGVLDPGNVFTQDGQAALSFLPGSFQVPAGNAPVSIAIQPQATYPAPAGFKLSTNVYCITSSSPVVPGKDPLVTLQYATNVTAPTDVYEYAPGGTWQKIGSSGSTAPYYVAARPAALGCFAGGYAAGQSGSSGASNGVTLPVVAGLAVAVVVLAAVPLLILRRRGAREDDEDE
ncbi:MAG: hypothetical protein E6J41_00815 [Chloroflexi bacterium]|nr:MAG: hypothetical protein E6J41_00815 [Chloroflexota bacterium]